jgi:hypothetical protein
MDMAEIVAIGVMVVLAAAVLSVAFGLEKV